MLHTELLEKIPDLLRQLSPADDPDIDDDCNTILMMLSWVARTRPDHMPAQVQELVDATIADFLVCILIAHSMGYDLFQLKEREALNEINMRIGKELARLLGVSYVVEEDWHDNDPRKSPPGLAIFRRPDGIHMAFMTEDEFDKRDHAGQN